MNTTPDPVRAYHQRTKHQPQRFAAGPDTLDWDAQPDPFRLWEGAPLTVLPLLADSLDTPWADLFVPGRVAPHAMSLASLGLLFELSFALTAWKQFGPDRWALRANPSSGNLHPTEVYVLARGVNGLADGLHHYAPREHALALRAVQVASDQIDVPAQLYVGLSTIQWREAWKYGERAFRYCQLDTGHALGALRYAAAALGWQARVVPNVPHAALAAMLGLDRDVDFGRSEREEPELLIQLGVALPGATTLPPAWPEATAWHGQASRLDAHPMYRWPVIDEVAVATRHPLRQPEAQPFKPAPVSQSRHVAATNCPAALGQASRAAEPASTVIRGRRSAQHFDRRASMPAQAFFRMAQALTPDGAVPWDAWPQSPRVHAVLYAHRVEGLPAGAYLLPRSASGATLLKEVVHVGQAWQPVAQAPADLPLLCLTEHPALAGALRTLSCHQAIGSDACFAVSLLAEFDAPLDAAAWQYRALFQEAGLIGQVLYLQAEAEGYRGTGIGCYFDDAVHDLLGLKDQRVQVLYHFTVGVPVVDTRISTEPPYAHRPLVPDSD